MRLIQRSDIKGPALYEGMRDDFRKRIMELKRPRRIGVGDRVTLVFENYHTLVFQTEEMLRAEGLTSDRQIQDELDVYNQLIPGDDSLSATLFIEVPPDADARAELDRLIGLDEHVILHIGDHAIRAHFDPGSSSEERISAVHYIRFGLPKDAIAALKTPETTVALEIDHSSYGHQTECGEDTRASLAADLPDPS